jgi:hypothetical protein
MAQDYSIHDINKRIDAALDRAKRLEFIISVMAALLFLTGVIVFIIGFLLDKNVAIGSGALVQSIILWPIKKLIEIREQNIKLGIIPSMTLTIPDDKEQARVLMKLLEQI